MKMQKHNLLKTNDLLNTHVFAECLKVQYFCLTLAGEASLWYECLRPIALYWNDLQVLFIQ